MSNEEVNDVYRKLDTIFKTKTKKIVKGTGLNFQRLLCATDLISNATFYILVVDNTTIHFKTQRDLYIHLIRHCANELEYKQRELKDLLHHKRYDLHFDDVGLDPKINRLSWEIEQLPKYAHHLASILPS